MVGRLEPVPLRDVWAKEAKDFTTWLSNDLEVLSEYLGLEYSLPWRPKSQLGHLLLIYWLKIEMVSM